MTVTVSLRANQSSSLSWAQGDANFSNLANAVNAVLPPSGGTTAARPALPVLYQPYFDTTLGLPIWCTQVSPAIWVTASGVPV
jgi:hypothetical protein